MPVYQLIYTSRKSTGLPILGIPQLAALAKSKNSAAGITGALLYRATHFLQILEEDAQQVNSLYLIIAADKRHSDLELINVGFSDQRIFSGWSMKYVDLEQVSVDFTGQTKSTATEEFRFPSSHSEVLDLLNKYAS